jgi:hypothetical protein
MFDYCKLAIKKNIIDMRIGLILTLLLFSILSIGQTDEIVQIDYNESKFVKKVIPNELYQLGYRTHLDIIGRKDGILIIKEMVRVDHGPDFYVYDISIHYYDLKSKEFIERVSIYHYSDPGGVKFGSNLTTAQNSPSIYFFNGIVYAMRRSTKAMSEIKRSDASLIKTYSFENKEIIKDSILFHTGHAPLPILPDFTRSSDGSFIYMNADEVLDLETKKIYKKGIVILDEKLSVVKYIPFNTPIYSPKIRFCSKDYLIWLEQTGNYTKSKPEFSVYKLNIEKGTIVRETSYGEWTSGDATEMKIKNTKVSSEFVSLSSFSESEATFVVGINCNDCDKNEPIDFFKISVDLVSNKDFIELSRLPYFWLEESKRGDQEDFQEKYFDNASQKDYSDRKISFSMGLGYNKQIGSMTIKREYDGGQYIKLYGQKTLIYSDSEMFIASDVMNFNPRYVGDYFGHYPSKLLSETDEYTYFLSNFTVPKVVDEQVQMREYFPQVLQLVKVDKSSKSVERYNIEGSFVNAEENWTFYTGKSFKYEGKFYMLLTTDKEIGVASVSY